MRLVVDKQYVCNMLRRHTQRFWTRTAVLRRRYATSLYQNKTGWIWRNDTGHDLPVTIKRIVVNYKPISFANKEQNGTIEVQFSRFVRLDDDSPVCILYEPPSHFFRVHSLAELQKTLSRLCAPPNGKIVSPLTQ